LQHRRVTLEKLITRKQDTAKFEVLDIQPPEAPANGLVKPTYFRGLDTDRPKMNAPRFPSALNIMIDLGLIESIDNNSYRLTSDGQRLLEKFRHYSIPDWQVLVNNEVAQEPESTS
jgi:hypothetical protein